MSALVLPQGMYARYGTYEFNVTTETIGLSVTPHRGADQRATAYSEWMIRLQFDVSTGAYSTVDVEMATLLSQLNHTGEEFIYRGRGLGNPDINLTGVTDIKFGPHPKVESMKLNAAGRAIEVVWSVVFCIPTCPEKWYGNANPFLEMAFAVTHTPDDAGFITRTFRGYAVIANNRTAPGAIRPLRSPDDYRESIATPLIEGFHRKYDAWTVSEDRTRLDFAWNDIEMPVIFPPDVVECNISETISSTKQGLVAWQGTISGQYRLRRGASGLKAALHFLAHVKEICTVRNLGLQLLADTTSSAGASTIVPMSFSATNPNLFGKPAANFSFGYTFSCGIAVLFKHINLWKPAQGGTWKEWTSSLKDSALHPYGGSKVRFKVEDDVILDPCYPLGRSQTKKDVELTSEKSEVETLGSMFPPPDAENSWLDYQCTLTVESDTGTVEIKTIPDDEPKSTSELFGSQSKATDEKNTFPTGGGVVGAAFAAFKAATSPTLPAEIESTVRNDPAPGAESTSQNAGSFRRAKPSCIAFLTGHAVRVGFPIGCPELTDVGGVVPEPASRPDRGEGFSTTTVGNVTSTIHVASWKLRYILPSVPTGPILPPSNPRFG